MFHPPDSPYELPERPPRDDETLLWPSSVDEGLSARLRDGWRRRAWVLPLLVFVASFGLLCLVSWERVTRPSADTHFVYLASTFNSMIAAALGDEEAVERRQGKLAFELDRHPPHRNDWASWWDITLKDGQQLRGIWLDQQGQGRLKLLSGEVVFLGHSDLAGARRHQRYFVSFPPGPALLMMPLAAIWGYGVNDVLVTILFAALNVMLMLLVLRRLSTGGRSGRGRGDDLWLTLLFGFGTVHFWCAVQGQVWFTALIVGASFTLAYIWFSLDAKHPFLAGCALAMAFATRTPLVFTAVFFYAFLLFPGGRLLRRDEWGHALRKAAWFSAPCLVMGLGLLWMNEVRFASFTEFGHVYLAGGTLGRIQTYGLFNVHFLSKNLTAMLTLLPRFQPSDPYLLISKHGMSLLLTTPAFIYLFLPKARESARDRFWWRLLWVTVAVTAIPGLLYQNTGYEQFGFRFSLDYTPYLVLLLAVGRRPLSWIFKALVLVGVAVNAFGAVTFKRIGKYYSEEFFV